MSQQAVATTLQARSRSTDKSKEGVEPLFTFYETRYPKEPTTYS
jgi:hypothetical protein